MPTEVVVLVDMDVLSTIGSVGVVGIASSVRLLGTAVSSGSGVNSSADKVGTSPCVRGVEVGVLICGGLAEFKINNRPATTTTTIGIKTAKERAESKRRDDLSL
jgi:hypothetical protein